MAAATSTATIGLFLLVLVLVAIEFEVIAGKTDPQLKLDSKILQESVIKSINDNPQARWKAFMNPRFTNYTVGQFKHLLGVKPMPKGDLKGISVVAHKEGLQLPEKFDARTAWPQCSTVADILDQGHCGSCWAFGAVEVLSDRFCIHLGVNITLSVNDLLACCGFMCGDGCDGGYPISAWRYFVHTGVVTAECDPYFDHTGCSHPGCEPAYPTPKCEKKCKKDNLLWQDSKHFSVNAYRISSDPYSIMAEVYLNGPVEVSFTVYEIRIKIRVFPPMPPSVERREYILRPAQDFAHYKSGVYSHVTGDVMGGHAVKLIGWGTTDNGQDYWLLANQWNISWGDDGYFMVRRGTNECGIEEDVVAGLPSPKNVIKKYGHDDLTRDASI